MIAVVVRSGVILSGASFHAEWGELPRNRILGEKLRAFHVPSVVPYKYV